MADWNKPTITSLYPAFVDEVDARLDDAATMFAAAPTNPPSGTIRYFRSTNKFQEWSGTAWVDLVISMEGGGTGGTDPGEIVDNLNLGTMSSQNANAVAITGGAVSGLTSLGMSGDITFATDNANKIGTNTLRPATLYLRSGLVTDKWVVG
jgi:hypothetical protein